MNKTILVIGSVTAKQYDDIRLEVLSEGHRPKIVRVTIEELFSSHEDLVRLYGSKKGLLEYWSPEFNDVYDQASSSHDDHKLFDEFSRQHLASFGDITAVIMDESAWDTWNTRNSGVAQDLKESTIVRWVVMNGQVQYFG